MVLLDISMPGLSGLEAARRLRKSLPEAKVVILTQHDDEGYLMQFLEAGCSGYVLKKSADHELTAAICSAMAGDTFVCPSMSKSLVDRYVRKAAGEPEPQSEGPEELSEREHEVVSLVAQGYTNKEVAETLFISVKTVETHKRRIMSRLGFSRRAQLVRYAMEHGLMGGAKEA